LISLSEIVLPLQAKEEQTN